MGTIEDVSASIALRHPDASVVVPPRATEVEVAVYALSRMLKLGRPTYVRTA